MQAPWQPCSAINPPSIHITSFDLKLSCCIEILAHIVQVQLLAIAKPPITNHPTPNSTRPAHSSYPSFF